ncbi:unnamed protein product [Brassica rapa subsp. trilocularis]
MGLPKPIRSRSLAENPSHDQMDLQSLNTLAQLEALNEQMDEDIEEDEAEPQAAHSETQETLQPESAFSIGGRVILKNSLMMMRKLHDEIQV